MKSSKLQFTLGLAVACAAITFSLAVCAQAQTLNYFADFNGANGWEPYGSVTQATDGNFYGTTSGGIYGVYGNDNVFRMTPTGEITSIFNFGSKPNCTDGTSPRTAPILGSDGNLYGVTYGGGTVCGGDGVVYKMKLNGEVTILHTFCFACLDGSGPNGIILASDGNFYGTTNYGGTAGVGTIFKITPAGKYTQLYSFCSQTNCADGSYSVFPPVQGKDGNFYGTASAGGTLGAGVFYQLTSAGAYKVIHNFCSTSCPKGEYAWAYTITQGANGNFYGTTYAGAFEITATGDYTELASFAGEPQGMGWPGTALTLASDGNFYGTFIGGGSGSWAPFAWGGIYEITSKGEFKPLHSFCCSSSGFTPLDPVFQATDGNFYGTTAYGGIGGGKGGAGDFGYGTAFQFSNGLGPMVETVPVAGKVGRNVIILGNNLTGSTSVTFNGVAAKFTVESDTYIKATVPPGATTGTVQVTTPTAKLNSNPVFQVLK